jgi:hypothetical protein
MKPLLLLALVLLALLLVSAIAVAQSGILLDRSVIAGGGGGLVNGRYSLTGTIGQALAGHPLHTGAYELSAGFWQTGAAGVFYQLYLPMVIR